MSTHDYILYVIFLAPNGVFNVTLHQESWLYNFTLLLNSYFKIFTNNYLLAFLLLFFSKNGLLITFLVYSTAPVVIQCWKALKEMDETKNEEVNEKEKLYVVRY